MTILTVPCSRRSRVIRCMSAGWGAISIWPNSSPSTPSDCSVPFITWNFIPNGTLSVLTNPEFVGFWADQRRRSEKENVVVILEDSDAALMPHGADNRDQVSSNRSGNDGHRRHTSSNAAA